MPKSLAMSFQSRLLGLFRTIGLKTFHIAQQVSLISLQIVDFHGVSNTENDDRTVPITNVFQTKGWPKIVWDSRFPRSELKAGEQSMLKFWTILFGGIEAFLSIYKIEQCQFSLSIKCLLFWYKTAWKDEPW